MRAAILLHRHSYLLSNSCCSPLLTVSRSLLFSASQRLRGELLPFRSRAMSAITAITKAARRKFAAPQIVIVSDRRLPGVERSKSAKPLLPPPLPGSSQIGVAFRDVIPSHPRLACTSPPGPRLA